jgi:thiamine biosynthesis lipoprotein
VTVIAGEAWYAEILAKAVFVAGIDDGLSLLAASGATGLALDDDGGIHRDAGIEAYLR